MYCVLCCHMQHETEMNTLEEWVLAKKSRSVVTINIDNGYGATCWEVVLGGYIKDVPGGFRWDKDDTDKRFPRVWAHEVSFFEIDETLVPPNVVYVGEDDFVGLEGTIQGAIDLANKLGM